MTLLFMDGFDHYAAGQVTRKWSGAGSTNASAMITGRLGVGQAMRLSSAVSAVPISPPLTNSQTVVVGAAVQLSTFASGQIWSLRDNGTLQVELRVDATGHLYVSRNTTQVGSATANAISINTWYYIEWKVTIDNAAGAFEIHVDEAAWGTGTGLDTQNSANAYVNQLLCFGSGSGNYYFDDLYVVNTAGATNNDFLGDCRIETILPSGAGNTTGFTPSAGANYAAVDDPASQDDDTTYVAASAAGTKDTYTMGDLTTVSGTVKGAQVNVLARKDNAGAKSMNPVLRHSGTDYDLTERILNAAYVNYADLRETNPATGAAWTIAHLNSAEFGVKVAS